MEKKPNKKEELTLVNNVLKLATKLLKVSAELGWVICSPGREPGLRRSASALDVSMRLHLSTFVQCALLFIAYIIQRMSLKSMSRRFLMLYYNAVFAVCVFSQFYLEY